MEIINDIYQNSPKYNNTLSGVVTLSGGRGTIVTTSVTSNSIILLTIQGGDTSKLGNIYISSITSGTSFSILSTNINDVSNVGWFIIEH